MPRVSFWVDLHIQGVVTSRSFPPASRYAAQLTYYTSDSPLSVNFIEHEAKIKVCKRATKSKHIPAVSDASYACIFAREMPSQFAFPYLGGILSS